MRRFACGFAGLLAVATSGATRAQGERLVASGAPVAELPWEFTRVTRVIELRDGRVVVLDRPDASVRLADLTTGLSSQLGRIGSGPGEYRIPLHLLPLGGDSVGVYDDGSVRILVIRPDGRLGGFIDPRPPSGLPGAMLAFRGDDRGYFYGEVRSTSRPGASAQPPGDSSTLVRWRIGRSQVEPIGQVERSARIVQPYSTPRPGSRSLWAVGLDGRVGIVNVEPYHVVLRSASGERVTGRPIPFERVPVNDSVKAALLSEKGDPGSVMIVDGAGRISVERTPAQAIDPSRVRWAGEVPPFRGDAFVAFDPTGRLWIQRTTFGREGARYDLIGPDGSLVDRVRLPEGHRVVAFGRDVMYVARRDADDLEYLQRRLLPGSVRR